MAGRIDQILRNGFEDYRQFVNPHVSLKTELIVTFTQAIREELEFLCNLD